MKYSIITVNLNNRDGLRKTIESVITQTCRDFEFIIIDGGSTDGSIDVVKEYENEIDYWVSEPDKGIYNAMNKGILQAHGEYLNFMNSGDWFYNQHVLMNTLLFFGNDILVGEAMTDYGKIKNVGYERGVTMQLLYQKTLPHQAAFIRRELFDNHLYDERYKIVSDWKFFLQALILENRSFNFINSIIVYYDVTGISNMHPEFSEKERLEVLIELFPARILADYTLYANVDVSTIELLSTIGKTTRFKKFVYSLLSALISTYKLCWIVLSKWHF